MRVLLLSAYDAVSHQYWRERLLEAFPEYHWTTLTLSARHFNWRIRGNSLTWSIDHKKVLNGDYDLCVCTSMVDLATLRGLVPHLAEIPTILYFHENQFEYPASDRQTVSIDALMVQLYSTLAADHVCFNSRYNRDSFFEGLEALLKKFPDGVPKDIVGLLTKKSSVLPVPISASSHFQTAQKKMRSFVWNHRWEYDKGPDRLKAFMLALPDTADITLHVVGQQFRQVPEEFAEIFDALEKRGWLGQWGYIEDRNLYTKLLAETEYVLSTSDHDFQGLAVLEAVAEKCIPILPDRLAYREIFSESFRYASSIDIESEAQHMAQKVSEALSKRHLVAPDVSHYFLPALKPQYTEMMERIAATASR